MEKVGRVGGHSAQRRLPAGMFRSISTTDIDVVFGVRILLRKDHSLVVGVKSTLLIRDHSLEVTLSMLGEGSMSPSAGELKPSLLTEI